MNEMRKLMETINRIQEDSRKKLKDMSTRELRAIWNEGDDERVSAAYAQQLRLVARELKRRGESLKEDFHNPKDPIEKQVNSLLHQGKRVLARCQAGSGPVQDVLPNGDIVLDNGRTIRCNNEDHMIKGNIDHFAIVNKKHIGENTSLRLKEDMTYNEEVDYWTHSLEDSIKRKGLWDKALQAVDGNIKEVRYAIADEAESITSSYHGTGEGIGTSDINHFIVSIFSQLGVDDVFGWRKPRKGVNETSIEKIGCLKCDEVSTKKAWQKNNGTCPKCNNSTQGVAESTTDEDVANWLHRLT